MEETVLGGAMAFLGKIGVYDIVLPFLLVFTLLFAFLEKTQVLGVEFVKTPDGKEHRFTRKNLNSIVAFTAAFFVVASSQLVRILSEVIANTMILLVAGLCFMLAIGVSHTGDGELDLEKLGKGWKQAFWAVNAIGIILIMLNALGWLNKIYSFLLKNWNTASISTVIMIVVFVGFMAWITKSEGSGDTAKKSKD